MGRQALEGLKVIEVGNIIAGPWCGSMLADFGATVIKVCGPDFSLSKALHAAPTFNYCPTFLTGGVTPERMGEAYACGNMLTAAGFDLILKGEDPAALTPEKVAERLSFFIETAKAARAAAQPFWKTASALSDGECVSAFPHYCSLA